MTTSRRTTNANRNCRPPSGQTYLTIGQDLFSIQEYLDSQYNATLHRNSTTTPRGDLAPAAAMVYTDIQTLRGLDTPADYGSGIEYANGLLDSVFVGQDVGLQIGLWLNGTRGCRQLVQGELDEQVHRLLKYLEQCQASRIFLRVGYEFDNPDFGYLEDPVLYRQAFRMLKEACLYQKYDCPSKVKFVWHSWGASLDWKALDAFYPGSDVVDWVGVSIFQQLYNETMMDYVYNVLRYARRHHKPIMIAESTPFGGIVSWEDWFGPILHLIDEYDISMWSYINCNWEAQPMWHHVGFGDTRLATNDDVMQHWHNQVLQGNRFLGAGSLAEYCGTPQVEKLSHQHPKRAKDTIRPQRRYKPPKHLLLAAFLMFWIILALWAWQRRHRRSQRSDRREMPPIRGFPGQRIHGQSSSEYGAVETTNGGS